MGRWCRLGMGACGLERCGLRITISGHHLRRQTSRGGQMSARCCNQQGSSRPSIDHRNTTKEGGKETKRRIEGSATSPPERAIHTGTNPPPSKGQSHRPSTSLITKITTPVQSALYTTDSQSILPISAPEFSSVFDILVFINQE